MPPEPTGGTVCGACTSVQHCARWNLPARAADILGGGSSLLKPALAGAVRTGAARAGAGLFAEPVPPEPVP